MTSWEPRAAVRLCLPSCSVKTNLAVASQFSNAQYRPDQQVLCRFMSRQDLCVFFLFFLLQPVSPFVSADLFIALFCIETWLMHAAPGCVAQASETQTQAQSGPSFDQAHLNIQCFFGDNDCGAILDVFTCLPE